MKALGVQIQSTEAILVILEKDKNGNIQQSSESTKFGIKDSESNDQIRQFRDQVNASLDNINADVIGILARNGRARGTMTPSPLSFKLEGIFQLYEKTDINLIWPQTLSAYYKKNPCPLTPEKKYQQDAFMLAYYLLKK